MEQKDYDEIKSIVDAGISSIITQATLPMCQIENARMEKIEEVLQKLSIVVVGNGHVEESLLWRQAQIDKRQQESEKSISKLVEIIDRRQATSDKQDSFQLVLRYITDKILPPLLTAGILGLIAFLWALQQHIIVIP